jgi:sigma-B regulation protein RsbU (phosphoserine phosphatase)
MSNLQAAVRAFGTDAAQPAEICQQVNRILCGNIAEGRFISFFYCTLDTDIGSLTFASAGHCPPILVRADASVERLADGGPVLGVFADASYDQRRVSFGRGDRLVLFTDGITGARRAVGAGPAEPTPSGESVDEEFGDDRLVELSVANRACSAPSLQARLVAAVAAHTGGAFHDDATLIVLAGQ